LFFTVIVLGKTRENIMMHSWACKFQIKGSIFFKICYYLTKRKNNALEESVCFEQWLFQSLKNYRTKQSKNFKKTSIDVSTKIIRTQQISNLEQRLQRIFENQSCRQDCLDRIVSLRLIDNRISVLPTFISNFLRHIIFSPPK
jgi:ribosomal 50S subunit-associated protein YjgA (DUF615 family)